jgi:hypothetical protein
MLPSPFVICIYLDLFFSPCSSGDSDEDSEAYIKPAKKTKPTAQPSMTDFFDKKPASKTTTARKASGSTKSQPPAKKAPVKKVAESSDDDELLLGDPESVAPIVPRATVPRRVAAAKPAYIELSEDD